MPALEYQAKSASFYVAGGTVPSDALSYVQREADTELLAALRRGEFCYVLNTRQIGKSSLMIRTVIKLREYGCAVAVLDITTIGRNLAPAQWYAGLLALLGEQLKLEDALDSFWAAHPEIGPLQRFLSAIRQVVLPALDGRLIVFVDEIDAVRSLPFPADEFFAAIRGCYNNRSLDPEYERLAFCLLGVATPADLISDTRISPFNIGTRIRLIDFTPQEAAPLAHGLAGGERDLSRILYWTGGHPYMTQRLCRAIAEDPSIVGADAVDRICEQLFLTKQARDSDDNLAFVRNRLLRSDVDLASLLELYRKVRAGKRIKDDETNPLVPVLRLSGVVAVRKGFLTVRNRVYDRVFDRDWVLTHMPDAEMRRQRAAYRKGVLRTAALASAVISVMIVLMIQLQHENDVANRATKIAIRDRDLADEARSESTNLLHVGDLQLAGSVWDSQDGTARTVEKLLDESRTLSSNNSRPAGQRFEWRYLWNLLHHTSTDSIYWDSSGYVATGGGIVATANGRIVAVGSDARVLSTGPSGSMRIINLARRFGAYAAPAVLNHGKDIIVASNSGQFTICDTSTLRTKRTFAIFRSPVTAFTVASDGHTVEADFQNGKIALLDADTGHILASGFPSIFGFQKPFDTYYDISNGARYRAEIDRTDTENVLLYDRNAFKEKCVPGVLDNSLLGSGGATAGVYMLAFSPTGTVLATGDRSGRIALWDCATRRLLEHWSTSTATITAIAFSPDGSRIAVGSNDGSINVYLTNDPYSPPLQLKGHIFAIQEETFSPNGRWLASEGTDHKAMLWDIARNATGPVSRWSMCYPASLTFSPDGRIVSGILQTEKPPYTAGVLLDSRTWQTIQPPQFARSGAFGHRVEYVNGYLFSPDNRTAACYGFDERSDGNGRDCWRYFIQEWNRISGLARYRWESDWQDGNRGLQACAAFTPDGACLLGQLCVPVYHGLSRRYDVSVWNSASGRVIHTIDFQHDAAQSISFSPDGSTAVFITEDGSMRRFDTKTWNETGCIPGDSWPAQCGAFSPDGHYWASAKALYVQLWDARTWTPIRLLLGHQLDVCSLAFSPDSQTLASASADQTIKLWDPGSGREVRTLSVRPAWAMSVAFSPDGTQLIAGDSAGNLRLWKAAPDSEVLRADATDNVPAMNKTPPTIWLNPEDMRKAQDRLDHDVQSRSVPGYAASQPIPNLLCAARGNVPWQFHADATSGAKATGKVNPDGSISCTVVGDSTAQWAAQFMRTGLPIVSGERYVLQFRAKSDRLHDMAVWVQQDPPIIYIVGANATLHLTDQWTAYRYEFTANRIPPNRGCLTFYFGSDSGTDTVSDIMLTPDPTEGLMK